MRVARGWRAAVALPLAGLVLAPVADAAPAERQVRPGQHLTVVLRGFAPHALVEEWRSDLPHAARAHRRADAHGALVVRHTVRTQAGRYRLVEVGAPPGRFRPPTARKGPARRDDSVLEVVVPRISTLRLRVVPRQGVAGVAAGPADGSGRDPDPSTSGAPRALGDTGADVGGLLGRAALLLAAGVTVLVAAGRRRGRSRGHEC